MFSTSTKIAFGYILLICLLFGAIGYIHQQMTLLTTPTGLEETISNRRKTTHQIVTQLYEAEIIGQTLRIGRLNEYPKYKRAMKEASALIDSLQQLLTDTLQQMRLDTVRSLLRNKEQNMVLVLEAMKQSPTDELYRQQLDSLIMQQDSILSSTHVRRRVVTHRNSYTIHHKPKKFFRRLADVFSPGKPDSTQVDNIIQEEYTDTIDEAYNPVDTIATMLTSIQHKVFQTRQESMRTLDARINQLRIAGGRVSQRVNQLLDNIEDDEQKAMEVRIAHEQDIRQQAAWTMATIAILAVLLVLIFFTIIWRDITRSNHYRKELEKAKLYAENLLVAREKLMLTITHDIKAPAGSIIGYIDLLIRLVQDRRQQFYLHNMKSSANHLLDLITSLLDYHRLEAGKMDIHPVTFNPHELFESIYTSFLPGAEKKQLTLNFEENIPRTLNLEGDPFRIRQIAENLISNALKFTSQGSITIQVDYEQNRFTFRVEDTGCGMSFQEQQRVFQAFTRLQSAQGQEGFGLGLSITKKLVELLNGEITIESAPGKGSMFQVVLFLPKVTKAPITQVETLSDDKKQWRILLIDDDRIQLNLTEVMIYDLFNHAQHSIPPVIKCCTQPEELFKLIASETFDIVFTDIQMPAMNGFELLQKLRSLDVPQAKNIPVIAITARSDMDETDFCTQGFAGCLHKPFNQTELLKIFKTHMQEDWKENTVQTETDSKPSDTECTYNFSPLTAFSGDDPAAAHEILETFIGESTKNYERMKQALSNKDMADLCNVAHKMLPTFTMIEARKAIPALQWLEFHRGNTDLSDEARQHADEALSCIADVIKEAKKVLNDGKDN
ncbi:hybrid sensor histidine kinase/response regulator [Phocaeicola coprocola]|uniref:hybrid sensor histidine kinase/response regulator n=1 Tax=Phocaeicola coprocola TaxID=310298 RepID=UPI001C391309|nr:ATP-binding protein [Phocaeicola coprocola]MBV3867218.1 response regulator [Phocaeicola coprocola]MBV4008368.1 response regulator [Phocaeicola coprocola]MBV4032864.1 response regulator [Phocaeicola coprocola]MBV4039447.1 response regulator [Phocaeicola coprocola]MBV4061077.1 response regulator [Phocaeicola coprocola]